MTRSFSLLVGAFLLFSLPASAAENYALDSAHTSVSFKVQHIGISWTHGRFNEVSGAFTLDEAKSSFTVTIKAESVDTGNGMRDTHLRGPDFFNVKQFPTITFKSTEVRPIKDGYDVTGELTLHGVTKPASITLKGGKKAEFPKGVQRIGFSTDFSLKRSDFGMDKLAPAVGDEVLVEVSFEGVKK